MELSTRPPVVPRSPEWPRIARAHLLAAPECVCCGPLWRATTPVQVHHIFPVHFVRACGRPDLELDARNLVTLCTHLVALPGQDHHLLVGHLDDFESANPASRADAERYRGQTAQQIRASAQWRSAVAGRTPPLGSLTMAQRMALRTLMDRAIPAAARR